jgi:hypothetical protein
MIHIITALGSSPEESMSIAEKKAYRLIMNGYTPIFEFKDSYLISKEGKYTKIMKY